MPRPRRSPFAVLASREASAGLTFGAVLAVFTLGGHALDRWLGTSPVLLLAGFLLGAVGGFVQLVETIAPGTLFRRRRGKDEGRGSGDSS